MVEGLLNHKIMADVVIGVCNVAISHNRKQSFDCDHIM